MTHIDMGNLAWDVLCPFSSPWDDAITNFKYGETLSPFLDKVVSIAKERGIPNLDEYIKERRWKLRASGNYVKNKTQVVFNQPAQSNFVATITNPQKEIETWLYVIGPYTIYTKGDEKIGEIKKDDRIYKFSIKHISENKYQFIVQDINDIFLIKYFKRIILKSAYCINCEVCEIECPTGALSVYPIISINKKKCMHCYKCLDFHDHGCIVADALAVNMENKNITKSLSRGTFGIHEDWIVEFLSNVDEYWANNTLGKKQVDSFRAWLRDAELLDAKGKATNLSSFCSEFYSGYPELIWEIIWVNLCYNSVLANWFINKIEPGRLFDKKILNELALEDFSSQYSSMTISYAITGFLQIFKYSPIGNELLQGKPQDKGSYIRLSYANLTQEGLVYSLYKFGQKHNVKSLSINDFYEEYVTDGPVREFGISRNEIEKILRILNSSNHRILIADLNMGLDNITLIENCSALEVLKSIIN